jgi:predicted solute-binding protein
MRILFPQNIFCRILSLALTEDFRNQIDFKKASVISNELESGNADLALVPSCDLLKHPDFFISKNIAISFDGQLSSSYIYFVPGQNKFEELFLGGDVSSNEVILSKILFKERYSSDIQIHLDTGEHNKTKNYLFTGDSNFVKEKYLEGLSFADELSTMLFLPYVNFIFVAKEEKYIRNLNENLKNPDGWLEKNISSVLDKLELTTAQNNFIIENFNSVYYEMTENELEGLTELIRLPYYHGIVDEIVDLKFV